VFIEKPVLSEGEEEAFMFFTPTMRRRAMPTYDYFCNDCKREFTLSLTMTEHEKSPPPACTYCGSKKVTPELSSATVITSKKS
jgi:putative FmdB family regulatory protein